MKIREAKDIAEQWVDHVGRQTPGFAGAVLSGSAAWMDDDQPLARGSDVDVVLILDGPAPAKIGKFEQHNVTLDVSYLELDAVRDTDRILADYHLAGVFCRPNILADTARGRLADIQSRVQQLFSEPDTIRRRIAHARQRVLGHLDGLDTSSSYADQVISVVFGAGVTTHVLLVAGLRNPTIRRRYVAVGELLAECGRLDVHEDLLALLGADQLDKNQVGAELEGLAKLFDDATAATTRPDCFGGDINPDGRGIAIDGSADLINAGLHREAFFWMAATAGKAQKVLDHHAAAPIRNEGEEYLHHLAALIGLETTADLQRRSAAVRRYLPKLDTLAEEIMARAPHRQSGE